MEQPTFTVILAGLVGAAGSLAGLVAGLLGAWGIWWKIKHRVKQEADASALSHFGSVIGHLERTIERQDDEIGELRAQDVRRARHDEDMTNAMRTLRDRLQGYYGWVRRFHSLACENARLAGRDPTKDVPPLPAYDDGELEHLTRTLEQTSRNVRDLSEGSPDQTGVGGSE